MLTEQIIEFELPGPGRPLVVHVSSPKTGYFHEKIKIFKANKFSSELSFTAKNIAGSNVLCFPQPGPSHLQNLTRNCIFYTCFGLDL